MQFHAQIIMSYLKWIEGSWVSREELIMFLYCLIVVRDVGAELLA